MWLEASRGQAVVEQTCHIQDNQGQMRALAFGSKTLKHLEVLPLRSEAGGARSVDQGHEQRERQRESERERRGVGSEREERKRGGGREKRERESDEGREREREAYVDQGLLRRVDGRLPGKEDSNSHGARPVHLIIMMIK